MAYKGATPSSTSLRVDPRIVAFYERFYAVSDNPDQHEEYARSLTPTAHLIMGVKEAKGYDEILAVRKAIWAGPIISRKHVLEKIFPFSDTEVMVYGSVTYGLRNGKEVKVEWAGRTVFEDQGGDDGLKMRFYQVYLDSAPVANAAKD